MERGPLLRPHATSERHKDGTKALYLHYRYSIGTAFERRYLLVRGFFRARATALVATDASPAALAGAAGRLLAAAACVCACSSTELATLQNSGP